MLGFILQHLRRWKWLDTALTRAESYTSLWEQYKAPIRAVAAVMLGGWAWLFESWFAVGLAVAVVVFATLSLWSFLPALAKSPAANRSEAKSAGGHDHAITTAEAATFEAEWASIKKNTLRNNQKIASFESDIRLLRHLAIHVASIELLSIAVEAAKEYKFPEDLKAMDLQGIREETEAARKRMVELGSILGGTHWRREFGQFESRAERAADEMLRTTPDSELPEKVSVIDVRHYVAAKIRHGLVADYLRHQKLETERQYNQFLSRLRDSEEAERINQRST